MQIKCDILVVGGGPAGLSTARAAAKKGLKTIVIEEHEEIGVPVQCAEAIGEYLFPYLPFEIPKEQLKWKIDGMYFWADNISIRREGDVWSGYSISRKEWDMWLASLAAREGAKILTDTKLISLETDDNTVKSATAISKSRKLIFEPTYVVGADGVNSTVIDCLGVKKKGDKLVGHVKSYEMKDVKLNYPKNEQLFFGEFAPRAYAYIFPLSKTRANVGIGTVYEKKDLDRYFEEFLEIPVIKQQLSKGKIVTEKSGDAPVRNLTDRLVYKNVFFVGDAANQNIKPFIEGNLPGIICGNILGEFLHTLLLYREKRPEQYERIIEEKFDLIKNSQEYTDIVYGESKIKNEIYYPLMLGLMSGIISPREAEIRKYVEGGYSFLVSHILSRGGFIEKGV